MKKPLSSHDLPDDALLIACSSHEERCEGISRQAGRWRPRSTVLFHYDDDNPKREKRHGVLVEAFTVGRRTPMSVTFAERDAAGSLHQNIAALDAALGDSRDAPVILDMSVLTKRHLLMVLRWLDDRKCWDRLWIVYTEPADYLVSKHLPLSFGLSRIQQIPGLCATPDMSRPLHLAIFLGYEGDRALAAYENVEPMDTTLVIPYPPYRPEWEGRTEEFNRDLIRLVGDQSVLKVDAIDPASTIEALRARLGDESTRSACSKVVCPLGTKPQTVGIYMYARVCADPPAVVYASPLRHNHDFYSSRIIHAMCS